MQTMKQTKKQLKTSPAGRHSWRRILLLLIIIIGSYLFTKNITLDTKVTIEQGENVSKIFNQMSSIDKLRIKLYLFNHRDISFSKLEAGSYTFSGSYTKSELVQKILQGSEKDYLRLTILEGRSIYDIDEALTRKGYITPWSYVQYLNDTNTITSLQQTYPFLSSSTLNAPLSTLEGFLYPDTYNVDKNKDVIPQLVRKQLETFGTRVRNNVSNPTDWYKTITLASILEKEERNTANKAIVAGIFLKRLEIWMALDADITLCYGLKQSYTTCTPAVIGQKIGDKSNPYNTRGTRWLPPTPISNPTRESINAIMNPQTSDHLYYLHDMQGNIHYGNTLQEHNANKNQYLK